MAKKFLIVLSYLCCLWGFSSHSQELNLFLHDVEEVRFNGKVPRISSDSMSKITFIMAINGIPLDDYHLVKLNHFEVTDENGNVLPEIEDIFYKSEAYSSKKRLEVTTIAPDRQITEIRNIKGSLQYFTPTHNNNGHIVIRDFLKRPNENLLRDHFPDVVLEIMDVDRLFDMEKYMQKMMSREVEKRMEEGPISDQEQEEIAAARALLTDIIRFIGNDSVPPTLTFQLNENLDDVFHRFTIFNGDDEVISSGYTYVDNFYQFYLTEPATVDCYLEILLESADAIKELPFQFKDIVLP